MINDYGLMIMDDNVRSLVYFSKMWTFSHFILSSF